LAVERLDPVDGFWYKVASSELDRAIHMTHARSTQITSRSAGSIVIVTTRLQLRREYSVFHHDLLILLEKMPMSGGDTSARVIPRSDIHGFVQIRTEASITDANCPTASFLGHSQ
jgi:hypothetical protein